MTPRVAPLYIIIKNGLTVGKATKATVVAALAICEKARIYMYAHFAQHVDSGVCDIRTLYDSYSLQKKNILKQINICIDSNEALNKLFRQFGFGYPPSTTCAIEPTTLRYRGRTLGTLWPASCSLIHVSIVPSILRLSLYQFSFIQLISYSV